MKVIKLSIFFLVVLLVVSPVLAQDWGQYQKDGHNTGGYLGASENGSYLYPTGNTVSSPVVRTGDNIYFGDRNGTLHSFNITIQEQEWMYPTNSNILGSPAVQNGNIYFAEVKGNIYSLSDTGELNWRVGLNNATASSPALSEGMIYITSVDTAYGINKSGEVDWNKGLQGATLYSPTVEDSMYVGTVSTEEPQPSGGLDNIEGTFYSLEKKDGEVNWRLSRGGVITTPAVSDDAVFFGTVDGMYAAEKTNGNVLWSISVEGGVSSPLYHDGNVYFGSSSGTLYSVDSTNGTTEWTAEIGGDLTVSPALISDRLYIGTRTGTLGAVGTDNGSTLWKTNLDSSIRNLGITAVGETVYVGTPEGVYSITEGDTENITVVQRAVGEPRNETRNQIRNGTTGQENVVNRSEERNLTDRESLYEDLSQGSAPTPVYSLIIAVAALGILTVLYLWRQK